MPRQPGWRDLRSGALIIVVLAALVAGVLLFARVGALRGDTIRVVVLAGSARELLAGSEVWIAGQKVGAVSGIEFRPASTDTAQRLAISLDVLTEVQPQLRADTHAEIKTGGSLLGAPIVALSGGSSAAPPLDHGDTIQAVPTLDPQSVASSFADAGRELPALQANVRAILGGLRDADGTLGAAGRSGGFSGVGPLAERVARLGRSLTSGRGTVGELVSGRSELRARIARVQARADSVRRVLDAPTGTLGRFRRDSSLATQIAAVRDEITLARALLDLPAGTAGRLVRDAILAEQLTALETELGLLIDDVKQRPSRYVVF